MSMKNPNPVKRKCVNLLEKDFIIIKDYCDKHSLKMPIWIGNMLVGIIKNTNNPTFTGVSTFQQNIEQIPPSVSQ